MINFSIVLCLESYIPFRQIRIFMGKIPRNNYSLNILLEYSRSQKYILHYKLNQRAIFQVPITPCFCSTASEIKDLILRESFYTKKEPFGFRTYFSFILRTDICPLYQWQLLMSIEADFSWNKEVLKNYLEYVLGRYRMAILTVGMKSSLDGRGEVVCGRWSNILYPILRDLLDGKSGRAVNVI